MENKNYYGTGISEDGVWVTLDNGKTWSIIFNGSFGDVEKNKGTTVYGSLENNGILFSESSKGVMPSPSKINSGNWGDLEKNNNFITACSLKDGELKSSSDGENWEEAGINYNFMQPVMKDEYMYDKNGLLLFILNKIIAPKLFMETTGKRFDVDYKTFSTLKNTSNNFFINSNKFINSNTLLDFEEDVGMKPFFKTIDDVISDEDNLILNYVNEDNKTIKKTILKIRHFLNLKKQSIIKFKKKQILNTVIDNTNLTKVEGATREEIANAIEMEKLFEGVMKSSAIAIVSAIYDRVLSLTDSQIRKLIVISIFEELNLLAPSINCQLVDIFRKYSNAQDIKKAIKKIDLSYSFNEGLEAAVNKYFSMLNKKVKKMTENEDEDLKAIAVSSYKKNRINYLKETDIYINNINISNISYSIFKDLNNEIENLKGNSFLNDLKNKIKIFKEEKSMLYIKTVMDIVYKDFLTEVQNIKIKFSYLENKEEAQDGNIKIIYNYLNDINSEFKRRCGYLLNFVYENEIDTELLSKKFYKLIENYLNSYLVDIEKAENPQEYFLLNKLNDENILKNIKDTLIKQLKIEWSNNKGVI